ncbi:12608_t:CDS:2 [Entrophospora sp. SA101]|nr:12608_t:CDS:2 [Entrophospora sp. SA101]
MTPRSKFSKSISHFFTDDNSASPPKITEHDDKVIQIEDGDDDFDPSLLPLPEQSTKTATQRIYRELKMIINNQSKPSNDLGFYVKLDKLRSVYQWVVQLKDFDPNIPLAQDMARHKVSSIDLEVRFAPEFPNLPPPRLLRFLNGGGGHVTAGGSICIEILTLGNKHDKGWSPKFTIESVLLQTKLALSDLNPPARLDKNWKNEYSPKEAIDAYIRVANQHGWAIPPQWSSLFRN